MKLVIGVQFAAAMEDVAKIKLYFVPLQEHINEARFDFYPYRSIEKFFEELCCGTGQMMIASDGHWMSLLFRKILKQTRNFHVGNSVLA